LHRGPMQEEKMKIGMTMFIWVTMPGCPLEKYLPVLKARNIDSLILGCTHYGLIAEKIKRVMGKKVRVIFQGKVVAEKLKDYLERHPEIEKRLSRKGKRAYFVTDLSKRYQKIARMFLGRYFSKKDKLKLVEI